MQNDPSNKIEKGKIIMGFKIKKGVLREYTEEKDVKTVTIPDEVTSIGDGAFYECTSLTAVKIPDSVTSIGSCAFSGCTNLQRINIPAGVTEIGENAFRECQSITSVTIPASVSKIGNCAFWGCGSLNTVKIHSGVTEIGNEAFQYCCNLVLVTIPKTVKVLGKSAFYECKNLSTLQLPEGLTEIGAYAFCGCKNLESATIPESVTKIGENAFQGTKCLKDNSVKLVRLAVEQDDAEFVREFTSGNEHFTSKSIDEYLHLCIDKKAYNVLTVFLDYMKTVPYILTDYKENKTPKSLAYIRGHFPEFMNLAIEQNDTVAVQAFAEAGGLLTMENINGYLYQCIDKSRNEILMILLDYKANGLHA